jgi:proteasome lid subunit RPN8/RPN11
MSSNKIIIPEEYLNQICDQALHTYPEECCGLLLGEITPNHKQVMEIWQTENTWQDDKDNPFNEFNHPPQKNLSKKNRFAIAPQTLIQAQKYTRDKEIAIIGIYHSHPDYPATPSAFDQAIAWAIYSYIIVSVGQNQINQVTSWSLDEDHQFQPESILTVKIKPSC